MMILIEQQNRIILKNMEQMTQKEKQKQRVRKTLQDIQETRRTTAATLLHIQETMKKMNQSRSMLQETRMKIQKFEQDYSKAMNSMAQKLANSFVCPYKKQQNTKYQHLPQKINAVKAAKILKEARSVFIITGAGLSASSGIRTFRDKGGYWEQKSSEEKDPKEVLTLAYFKSAKQSCWDWHKKFYQTVIKVKPNDGHIFLEKIVRWLKQTKVVTHSTQNIDNLSIKAAQIVSGKSLPIKDGIYQPIYQIHGNIMYARCQQCRQMLKSPFVTGQKKCKCGQQLRPHTMFFDESYDQTWHRTDTLKKLLQESDVGVFIGTSLQTGFVSNAASHYVQNKKYFIEINMEANIQVGKGGFLEGKSDKILAEIFEHLKKK